MSQVNILYWGGMLSIVLAMHGRATADSAKYPVKFINLIDDSLKISALESDDNLSDTLDDEATIHPGKAIAFYVQGERKKDTSKRSYKMSVCNSGVCKAVYTMTFELESRWNGSGRIRIEGDSKQYAVRKRPKGQSEYKFNLVIIDYKNDTNSNDPRTVKNPIELINLTDETFTISKCSSDKDVSDDLSSSKKIPRGKAFDFTVFGKHRWFSTIGATIGHKARHHDGHDIPGDDSEPDACDAPKGHEEHELVGRHGRQTASKRERQQSGGQDRPCAKPVRQGPRNRSNHRHHQQSRRTRP